jgi:hypothetical protein
MNLVVLPKDNTGRLLPIRERDVVKPDSLRKSPPIPKRRGES